MLSLPSTTFLVLTFGFFSNEVYGSIPQVDYDRMGKVGLAGAFAGLDIFQNASTIVSFDPSTSSLLSRTADGTLTRLTSTNVGGRILSGCSLSGDFYFAGSFSTIDGMAAANVASYASTPDRFDTLELGGPNGEVNAMFCDTKDNKLWVGGKFTSPGSSIATWDPRSRIWSEPPFVGVSGAQSRVLSITSNSSDASIFFAGSFITSFQGTSLLNGTNNPNVPFSPGSTPFSSSLVPIPLDDAEVDGSPSSQDSQFSRIKSILCPSGPDGPGNTWFAGDGNTALVTVRTFTFMSVNGVRLGNTFLSDHGTTSFSVTTIPDNKVQTLQYVDLSTGQMKTCSDPCPLGTDSNVLYQDFTFDDTLTITGVQLKLSGFTGAAPGLHMFQLLSSGAFASSVESSNGKSCFAPNPSNTTRTGNWDPKVANTDIAGTIQTVLVSSVDVGAAPGTGPSFTWIPYVSASGVYDVNLLVPGCKNLLDCPLRTTVKITVFPGNGLQPWVSTISQQNTSDTAIRIYTGPIFPSSPDFVATITMSMADNPVGNGQDGKYELVADRVQLVLKSVSGSADDGLGGIGSSNGREGENGFGFLEWPRSISGTNDGTKVLPNNTRTFLDAIGLDFFAGIGGATGLASTQPTIATVVHHPSGDIFLGGNFTIRSGDTSSMSNIAVFKDGNLVSIVDGGLNGPVTSLVLYADRLYVGGSFNDTALRSTGGQLNNIAMYDIQDNRWIPLGTGVNGEVTSLGLSNKRVQVLGKFTRLLNPVRDFAGANAAGLAVWDVATSTWVNSGGFLVGDMSFIGNGTSTQIVAGNVIASQRFGASGMVFLENGDKNGPRVTPLGASLDSTAVEIKVNPTLRERVPRAAIWMSHVKLSRLFSRQVRSTQLPPLPADLPALAPAVLAGTFWKNSSSNEVAIIGGNFSFHSQGDFEGVAIYDPESGGVQGLQGPQINGSVRTLLVDENLLYVGGQFTISGTSVNGVAIYDLSKHQWNLDAIQALEATQDSTVVVRSITKPSSQTNKIIVAGSFAKAGSLQCQSICLFDTESKQWNALGNGIQGEVTSIAYAGLNQELLIAAGSIGLGGNHISNVVQFSFPNTTWTALGTTTELPGTVTAVEVNNGNASSIFAAGRSIDGLSTFLSFWNGDKWSSLGPTFQGQTNVAQLTMVPLSVSHSAHGMIESDRMLMVSGLLSDSLFGNASAALFDGENFIPYIVATSAAGTSGTVASLFRSLSSFSFDRRHFLATGVVILISIAIAAGVVFLLALMGILWTLFSRRDDKLNKCDAVDEDDDDSTHHRPSSLLEHINAATRTTILGGSPFTNMNIDKEEEKLTRETHDPFGPDASNYIRAETPSDAVGGMLAEETSRPAHARYSFDGIGEGELPISAGAEVEVLDDRDPAWWYARDMRTGREGVVPAAYLY
ncbi:cortical protein marker for cell polarity-domain-containing protein [Collybia nuda]|uniref:Cortical protein marker for cell polarity-domain-containing protein n=1 Tax=Collybia nuda TaxID=64659 RepID=A0A9P5XX85_9AGAR|nr:cortical protein marker for cell polarity-domain-containing protein [Collybia nuda]